MLGYQHQDSKQTLSQGLAEYHAAHPGLLRGPDLSPAAARFFACHDAAHVVFGCGTALADEAVVKLCSLFGTSAGFGVLEGYRLHESRDIYRRLRLRNVLATMVAATWLVPRTWWRCRGQRSRWPWDGSETYLDQPLADVRRGFGIQVAHRNAPR